MLKPIISKVLRHLIAQNNWAKHTLINHAGKVLQFEVSPIKAHLIVMEDGTLAVASDSLSADASIKISLANALKMLAKIDSVRNELVIIGDNEFASEVGKVLSGLSWDVEEDLSHLIGESAAYESVKFAKTTCEEMKQQMLNVTEIFIDYWQEERPMLAKKYHVENFNQVVDVLRNDVARLDKKIEKLATKLEQKSAEK